MHNFSARATSNALLTVSGLAATDSARLAPVVAGLRNGSLFHE
jgi:hypothetical protein